METDKKQSIYLSTLRKRAEKLLNKKPGDFQSMPQEDIQRLIHELNVHQIELEMQNEELRQAQLEIEESRRRYFDLYDFAPVGYFTLNAKGLIVEVNLTGADMLGVERRFLIKNGFSGFIDPDFQDVFFRHREQAIKVGAKQSCQLKLRAKDGTAFYAQMESVPIKDNKGDIKQFRMTITDITENVNREEKLQRRHKIQKTLNRILNISLKPYGLHEMLDQILQQILLIDWISLEPKGAIFLLGDKPDELVMKSSFRVSDAQKTTCSQVPFGKCYCGKAALTKKVQFSDCIDEHHENRYEGITPHGHYCIPIQAGVNVVGVLYVCLEDGHGYEKEDEDFLRAVAGILAGIIERKQSEEKLQVSKESLDKAQEVAHLGNWEWDIETDKVTWSDELYRIYGIDPKIELNRHKAMESIHPYDRDYSNKIVARWMEDRKGGEFEYRINRSDGTIRFVKGPCEVFCDGDGKPMRMLGVVQDVTERKQAEEELEKYRQHLEELVEERTDELKRTNELLRNEVTERKRAEDEVRKSEEKYRMLIKTSNDAIFLVEEETGMIIETNKKAEVLLGRPQEEIIGMHYSQLHPPNEIKCCGKDFLNLIEEGGNVLLCTHVIHKGGHKIPVEITGNIICVKDKRIIQGIFRDISERKQAEKEIKAR